MQSARVIKNTDSQEVAVVFAIRLHSMHITPLEERHNYEFFVKNLLTRQMDFIHALHELPPSCAVELRYLYDPRQPNTLSIYFLAQASHSKRAAALKQAAELEHYLLHLLMVNNHLHEFHLVKNARQLRSLSQPFAFRHIVEIHRREDLISLDTVRFKPKRLGFLHGPEEVRLPTGSSSSVYYVFPYFPHSGNMERLCNMLSLQPHPCLVSICLRPYRLTLADENFLTERLKVCEKYAQLTLDGHGEVRIMEAYLKNQAQALHKECDKEYLQLLDAAFLIKVQLASTHPLRPELINMVGTTITEHSGVPHLGESDSLVNVFSGGYDVYQPEDRQSSTIARRNLQNMTFTPAMPTLAPDGLSHWRFLFDVSEALAVFRLPIPVPGEFPGIETTLFQPKPAPVDLPNDGLLLGEHWRLNRCRKVCLQSLDRQRHAYVVGKTGTGKSTLLLSLILQDLQAGRGLGLIDPHGELVEEVLACIPAARENDVIYIDPQDPDRAVGLNLLECTTSLEKDFAINYLIEVFDVLYDLRQTGGPIFELYMRNSLQLLMEQPGPFTASVLEVPRIFQDRRFRRRLIENCRNPYARKFWEDEALQASRDLDLPNIAPYITSKLSRFVYNDFIRTILGQRRSTINFREAMDEGKILLVDLRKGLLGETNSHFLGMLLVGKLFAAALSRTEVKDKTSLRDFYLYVDEFQNLATPTFVSILSEARKYRLSLILANQYISQLKEHIIHGIFGNVGSLISYRVGFNDAEILSKEFARVVSENDLLGLSNFNAYVKLLVDGSVTAPFDLRSLLPDKSPRPEVVDRIRQLSRERYSRPREEVEAEVRTFWLDEEEA